MIYNVNIIILMTLLPSLAKSRIVINMEPDLNDTQAEVRATGTDRANLCPLEQKTFHLTDKQIIFNLERFGHKIPTFVYTLNTSRFGFTKIDTILKPVKAQILSHKKQTVNLTIKEFENNSSISATYRTSITQLVHETLTTKWHKEGDISERDVFIKFRHNSLIHKARWGKDEYKNVNKTLSSTTDVEVVLQPGQKVTAVLSATRAVLTVRVDYVASLEGQIFVLYAFFYLPYETKAYDVNEYFGNVHMNRTRVSHQIITVDYYFGAHVVMTDFREGPLDLVQVEENIGVTERVMERK